MKDDKKSFIVYSDLQEVLGELTDEEAGRLFRAMIEYSITGEVGDLGMPLKYVFIPIRQQMDRDRDKWEGIKEKRSQAGRKGGASKGNRNAAKSETLQEASNRVTKNKQNKQSLAKQAKQAVNVNVNVNGTVNENVINSGPGPASLSSSLLGYLNEKVGSSHKPNKEITGRIRELLKEGYTEKDFKDVIDKKVEEWQGVPLMRPYLRPSTLFGDKFPEYAAEPKRTTRKKQPNTHDREYNETNIEPGELEKILFV